MPSLDEARRRTAHFYLTKASRLGSDFRALDVEAPQILNALDHAARLQLVDDLTAGLAAISAYLNSSGRRADALKHLDDVLGRSDLSGRQRAELLLQHGLIMRYSGELPTALEDMGAAQTTAEMAGAHALAARVELAIGWVHFDRADLELAEACFDTVLQSSTAAEDVDLGSSAHQSLANVRYVQGNYTSARQLLRQALHLAQDGQIAERIGNIHQDLGWIDVRVGNLASAREHFEAGLEAIEGTGSLERRCNLLQALGAVAEKQQQMSRARELWEQSLEIAIELAYPAAVAGLLHNLGGLAVGEGNSDAAERYLTDALQLAATIDQSRHRRGAVLSTLGQLRIQQHRYGDARRNLEEGLELARSIGDRWMEAEIRRVQGEMEIARGDRSAAEVHLRAALQLAVAIDSQPLIDGVRGRLSTLDETVTGGG